MRRIQHFERILLSLETWCLIGLVGLMLFLAGYNVAYRNLLVPLQRTWATSGPVIPAGASAKSTGSASDSRISPEASPPGFAGGLAEQAEEGGGEGFAGGLAEQAEEGGGEGFAGGLADQANAAADGSPGSVDVGRSGAPAERSRAGEGGVDPKAQASPLSGGPPQPDSWRARGIEIVDALKLEWIDVLLRQLVIIVSFLGAMLATQRRKHINVDAVSRVLNQSARRWVDVIVNVLSVGVCIVLATAGADLVSIGREFPKALFPWADEWMFQLMFPVGFGLLACHFALRLIEALMAVFGRPTGEDPK